MGSMSYRGKDRDGREVRQLQVSLGYNADTQTYPKITVAARWARQVS